MKSKLISILFLATLSINAQKQDVEKCIKTFFEGFHGRDSVKIKSVCNAKMILQSITESPNGVKLSEETSLEFYKSIASIPIGMNFQEKIISYSIQIDGAMAHAWTPYEFYINNKLSHIGVNAFTLFKENDEWKIIYLIDTKRKQI